LNEYHQQRLLYEHEVESFPKPEQNTKHVGHDQYEADEGIETVDSIRFAYLDVLKHEPNHRSRNDSQISEQLRVQSWCWSTGGHDGEIERV